MELLRHADVAVGGKKLHYVSAGAGPPVVLVHGFPEFWFSWREQIPALAAAGWSAFAVDLRGYNRSHRPPEVDAYRIDLVAAELATLIETLSRGPVHLVGHDWGGVVSWLIAMQRPELLTTLTVINIPHPATLRRQRLPLRQTLRFSYQLFLQPRFAEPLLAARRFALLRRIMKRASLRPEGLDDDVLAAYEEAWAQPGALRGMLNYYRALRRPGKPSVTTRVTVPTLLLHADREPVFLRETIEASRPFVDDLRIETVRGAAHFAHQDQPGPVNELLLTFLGRDHRPKR